MPRLTRGVAFCARVPDPVREAERLVQHAGLRSDVQGLLWFGSRWDVPRRAQLRFSAQGVRVLRGELPVETLDWEDYRAQTLHEKTWWIHPRFANANPTTVEIGASDGDRVGALKGQRRWKLRDPVLGQIFIANKFMAGVPLKALCEYLAATPDARPGLEDPSRCDRLVKALRSAGLGGAPTEQDRMNVGRKGDAREAIRHAAEAHMRYFQGRPVSGDKLLTAEELTDIALQRFPTWVGTDWRDPAKLRGLVADQLAITPWPFGVLREA